MTVPAEIYEGLFKEARVEVDKAVYSFVKSAAPAPAPVPPPHLPYTPLKHSEGFSGLLGRMANVVTGRQTRGHVNVGNEALHQAATAGHAAQEARRDLGAFDAAASRLGHSDALKHFMGTRGGKVMAGVGAAGLIAAPLAWAYGKHQGERNLRRARNVGAGAGFATGLAAPRIIQGAAQQMSPYVGPQGPPQGYPG